MHIHVCLCMQNHLFGWPGNKRLTPLPRSATLAHPRQKKKKKREDTNPTATVPPTPVGVTQSNPN